MAHPSLPHLQAHHGDFDAFREAMVETAKTRFGAAWWGVWDQHVACAPDATVIDLGSGPGALLAGLRARVPRGRIVAVDIQPAMLPTLRARAAEVAGEVVEADLAAPLPLPDGVADVVVAVHVLHELRYPPTLLDEAARLLRPGGKLVLYDWLKRPLREYLGDAPLTPDALQHFREHCLFAAEDIQWLCERVGLRTVEIVSPRSFRYAVFVVQKPDA